MTCVIYDRCCAIKDANVSMLDSISPAVCSTPPPEVPDDNPFLHVSSLSLEGTGSAMPGFPYRTGVFSRSGVYNCLPCTLCNSAAVRWVWRLAQRKLHSNHLELLAVFLALKHFPTHSPCLDCLALCCCGAVFIF